MNVQLPIDAATELHASSPTDRIIYEMQVYGYRPFQDEPDPRPLPEEPVVQSALTAMFDAFVEMLGDTRLEPDLEDLLWSTVNLFHRAGERIQRELQRNEDAQRNGQREQDGSEVKSVELERHIMEGISLLERRNAFEFMRDYASDLFEAETGSTWRPRTGSKVNHANMTAAMIDSRDFLSARRRAETEVLIPAGTKIASAAAWTITITTGSGRRSTRPWPNTPTWCCCMAVRRRVLNASRRAGLKPAA